MSRTVATARQVSELTGFLLHVLFALRPRKFVVGRLLAAVWHATVGRVSCRGRENPGRRVVFLLFYFIWFFTTWLCSLYWP